MSVIVVKDAITPSVEAMAKESPQALSRGMLAFAQRWKNRVAADYKKGNINGQTFAALHPFTQRMRQEAEYNITFRQGAGLHALRKQFNSERRQMRREGVTKTSARWSTLQHRVKRATANVKRLYARLDGFGGSLPQLAEFQPQTKFDINTVLRIGYLGVLRASSDLAVARYQKLENRALNRAERHKLHLRFGKNLPITYYTRPARNPLANQQAALAADFEPTVRKAFERIKASYKK